MATPRLSTGLPIRPGRAWKRPGAGLRRPSGRSRRRSPLPPAAARLTTEARGRVATALGAEPEEISFTAGGSEADNWAIKGVAAASGSAGTISSPPRSSTTRFSTPAGRSRSRAAGSPISRSTSSAALTRATSRTRSPIGPSSSR
ncbi:protein of unknown function [Methanoculleus bourgensis]|uniref:Aminotransferase class V domain-containing protein n=1 Tax=Methanoculleus bourgensis TaxID=83986 RepID=A0A0X3BIC4_9EURY|nr:protein of unknown function [Methanoculleus bourgensis]